MFFVTFCYLGSYTEFWSDLSFSNPNDFTVIFPLVAMPLSASLLRFLDMVEGFQNRHAFTYEFCFGV
jgi:hypothetical protein